MKKNGRLITLTFFILALILFSTFFTSKNPPQLSDTTNTIVNSMMSQESSELVFIHGAGEGTEVWAEKLAESTRGYALDWSHLSDNRILAPQRGYSYGKSIGLMYLNHHSEANQKNPTPINLTFYAHSAGAWVAQGIIDGIFRHIDSRDKPIKEDISINLILMDPFTAKSLFQPFAGRRSLGRGAKIFRTYFTTIDPIPFTNGKVNGGQTFDISRLLPKTGNPTEAHWQVIDFVAEKELGIPWKK